jgi:4-hydroxy-tetrahydrodipicolinate synthase
MFSGSLVALITPFKNGRVDENRLADLIEWHLASGTHGIVPCGTTGESATLSHEEHTQVVKFVAETDQQAHTGRSRHGIKFTTEAIRLTREAGKSG